MFSGIAAQEGHESCVRALLNHGADPNHSDRCGRNALRVAAKSGHDAVVRLLEEFSATHKPSQSQPRSSSGGKFFVILISDVLEPDLRICVLKNIIYLVQ